MNDDDFKLHVVAELATIKERVAPLPGMVADHGRRLTEVENRHFKITALAAAFGLVFGFVVQPISHAWAALAAFFRG